MDALILLQTPRSITPTMERLAISGRLDGNNGGGDGDLDLLLSINSLVNLQRLVQSPSLHNIVHPIPICPVLIQFGSV
jgi:hypothetical protein